MPNTTNLGLPYMDANQNQKYVTYNDALRMLDALAQIAVQSAALAAPPGSPADGQCWIVAASATGAWLGKDLQIAAWQDGAWDFYAPKPGYIAFDIAAGGSLMWTGAAWSSLLGTITSLGLSTLGIGTAADPANPLSVLADNVLFAALTAGGGTGDIRAKLSKATAANTASLLLQDNLSGRAEIGLAGDDNLHVKTSPDGTTWIDSIVIDKTLGSVDLYEAETTLASAATVDLGSVNTMKVAISGTTTITSFGTRLHAVRLLRFAGALTLTHNATSLILPGGASIATAAGDTAIATSDGAGNWRVRHYQRAANGPDAASAPTPPQGRLTLTSGVPVLTATVAAAANVYYALDRGNQVPLWNGSVFVPTAFSELTNVLSNAATGSAGPFAACANAVFDLFVWNNAGAPTLTRGDLWQETATVTNTNASPAVFTHTGHNLSAGSPVRLSVSGGSLSPGFTAGTTYYVTATSLAANTYTLAATVGGAAINAGGAGSGTITATAGIGIQPLFGGTSGRFGAVTLSRVNGILVNASAIANGPSAGAGTYVGTIMTDPTGATVTWQYGTAASNGGAAIFGVWNAYNRRFVETQVTDTSTTWTYASTTVRPAHGSSSFRVTFVSGQASDFLEASFYEFAGVATSGVVQCGIGYDQITTMSGIVGQTPNATVAGVGIGSLVVQPLGAHFCNAMESVSNTNTATITGTSAAGVASVLNFEGWL